MTVRETLADARRVLAGPENDTPDLDASLLLAHAMGVSRAKLYMELRSHLPERISAAFNRALKRRLNGEPVAWITGRKEFWGRSFNVGPGVLTPRPDSEVLIEEALALMDGSPGKPPGGTTDRPRLHDCCTGPGTLALTLKAERPDWEVSASDISDEAASYFAGNNDALCNGEVSYIKADLMDGIAGPFDIIVSNPPYLTPGETRDRVQRGWKEPALALDGGGEDGLDLIRRLVPAATGKMTQSGWLLIEADPLQMPIIGRILEDNGFTDTRIRKDLGNRDRVIIARKDAE